MYQHRIIFIFIAQLLIEQSLFSMVAVQAPALKKTISPAQKAVYSEFLQAILLRQSERTKELLTKNINIDQPNEGGDTLLHEACRAQSPEIVEQLLTHYAQCKRNSSGMTPLHIAALHNNTTILSLLLPRYICNIDDQDVNEMTPLHLASTHGHLQIADLLVKHGACINIVNKTGHTPLTLAKNKRQSAIVDLLSTKK